MNLVVQFLVKVVLMVIQANLVFQDQRVKITRLNNREIYHLFLTGERGLPGLPGLPGNSSAVGGLPGPQGRMCFFLKLIF